MSGIESVHPAPARTLKLDQVCIWSGCRRTAPAVGPLPQGWRNLLVWQGSSDSHSTLGAVALRSEHDAILCPEHFRALENLLKRLR